MFMLISHGDRSDLSSLQVALKDGRHIVPVTPERQSDRRRLRYAHNELRRLVWNIVEACGEFLEGRLSIRFLKPKGHIRNERRKIFVGPTVKGFCRCDAQDLDLIAA